MINIMSDEELSSYANIAKKLQNKMKYDEEPVWYCESCLSLAIICLNDNDVPHYCRDCSSTKINNCDISKWRVMYSSKYGFEYLNK